MNYDLLKKELEMDIEGAKFRAYLCDHQRGGAQTLDELGDRLRFETVKDYRRLGSALRSFPGVDGPGHPLMREGARAKVMWPKIVLERVPAQIDKQIVRNRREPVFKPLRNSRMHSKMRIANVSRSSEGSDHGWRASFVPEAEEIFRGRISAGRVRSGGRLADAAGAEFYTYLARRHTTTI